MTKYTMAGWTSELVNKIRNSAGKSIKFSNDEISMLVSCGIHDPAIEYNGFMYENFGIAHHYPHHIGSSSIKYDTKYGNWVMESLHLAYTKICNDLFSVIVEENVEGVLVEFGVFRGTWLKHILDYMDKIGTTRETLGFDSFEGLPKPDYEVETENWKEGAFAASIEEASEYLSADRRPHLKLIKGWFKDSFPLSPAKDVTKIAYAKIDCDLYEPTVEILDYLKGRLSHGAVMVFDDWTHALFNGETRAFAEWMPRVPEYEFEIIGYLGWQYILRVWHKGVARK